MDILSFILGMSMVVVIAVAVVAVMAFVRVNKLNKEIEIIHTVMGNEIETQNREWPASAETESPRKTSPTCRRDWNRACFVA